MFPSKAEPRAAAAAKPLAVHEVGDFIATFVPTIGDFGRVDPRFVISKDVWAKIPAYADYGFTVFQLKALSGSPHPIAFEFDTRLKGSVFYPTVHIHDGTVHETGDFDHVLYLQEASFDPRVGDYRGPETKDSRTDFVRSKSKAKEFVEVEQTAGLVDPNLLVHRVSMSGSLPNKDMIYSFAADSPPASGCGRCDVTNASVAVSPAIGAAGAAIAGLSWIIRRRETRARE